MLQRFAGVLRTCSRSGKRGVPNGVGSVGETRSYAGKTVAKRGLMSPSLISPKTARFRFDPMGIKELNNSIRFFSATHTVNDCAEPVRDNNENLYAHKVSESAAMPVRVKTHSLISADDLLFLTSLDDRDLKQVLAGTKGEISPEQRFLMALLGIVLEGGGTAPQVHLLNGRNPFVYRRKEVADALLSPEKVYGESWSPQNNVLHAAIDSLYQKVTHENGVAFRDLTRLSEGWDLNGKSENDLYYIIREEVMASLLNEDRVLIPGNHYCSKFFSSQNNPEDISVGARILKRLRAHFGDAVSAEFALSYSNQTVYSSALYLEKLKSYVRALDEEEVLEVSGISLKDMVGTGTPEALSEVLHAFCEWIMNNNLSPDYLAYHCHETDNPEELTTRSDNNKKGRALVSSAAFYGIVSSYGIKVGLDGIFSEGGHAFPNMGDILNELGVALDDDVRCVMSRITELGNDHRAGLEPAISGNIYAVKGSVIRELDIPGGAISSTFAALAGVALETALKENPNNLVPNEVKESWRTASSSEKSKIIFDWFCSCLEKAQADLGYPWKVTPGYQHCMITAITLMQNQMAGQSPYTNLPPATQVFLRSTPMPCPMNPQVLDMCCKSHLKMVLPRLLSSVEDKSMKETIQNICLTSATDKEWVRSKLDKITELSDELKETICKEVGVGQGQFEGKKDVITPIIEPVESLSTEKLASLLPEEWSAVEKRSLIDIIIMNPALAEKQLKKKGVSQEEIMRISKEIESLQIQAFPEGLPRVLRDINDFMQKVDVPISLVQALVLSQISPSAWRVAIQYPRDKYPHIWPPDPKKFAKREDEMGDLEDVKAAYLKAIGKASQAYQELLYGKPVFNPYGLSLEIATQNNIAGDVASWEAKPVSAGYR